MIGTTIANYRIEEKLGEGGMGVVYKAIDLNLDRTVAIKVLAADLSRDPGLLERFRAEAKAQAHLNHTNIASLYNLLTVDNHTSIVMEYLEGETLDEMLRRRGLIPSQEALPLFRQALLGIGFAHRMGIVHRDIKPSNIMVNKYGVVKVMDFGIAKVLGGQRLTRTGTQVGTVSYMSPEQIRNLPVDIRSDIYSLGVTLYELLTAHLPFESDSEFQVMSDHVNTPPPPPTRHYPYIPRGIEQCVLKALEKNPDARFQTVEDFGSALEHPEGIDEWLAGHPGHHAPPLLHTGGTPPPASIPGFGATTLQTTPAPGVQTPAPSYATPPLHDRTTVQPPAPGSAKPAAALWSKKNRPFIAAGAAVLVLALGIGAYEIFKPKPQPIISGGGGGGGGGSMALSDTSSHRPQSDTNANPLLSATSSPGLDTSTASTDTAASTAPQPATTTGDSSHAMQDAQNALRAGRLFRPRTNSAFYWAKQAEQSGNADAPRLEQTILETAMRQVQKYREAKNFPAAATLVSQIAESYPNRSDVAQLSASVQNDQRDYQQQQIQAQQQQTQAQQQAQAEAQRQQQIQAQQQAQAAAEAQRQQQIQNQNAQQLGQRAQQQSQTTAPQQTATASFAVEHRHVGFNPAIDRINKSFCAGTLSIAPNGTIRYDCLQTQDMRCDHVTFSASDVKQAKLIHGGGLHIATRTMGNWDFFGQPQQIDGAFQAVSQLVAARH